MGVRVARGPAVAPVVAADGFDRANGALGTADFGGSWSTAGSAFELSGGRASRSVDTTPIGLAWPAQQALTRNVVVSAAVIFGTYVGVFARGDGTTQNYYLADRGVAGNDVRLVRFVAGAATVLQSTTYVWQPGDILSLRIVESQLIAAVNGVPKLTLTDTSLAGPGLAGLRVAGSSLASWDSFQVRQL